MTGRLIVLACALGALLVVPGSAHAVHGDGPHGHDSFAAPVNVPAINSRGPDDNAGATVQGSEPLTVQNDGSGCTTGGTLGANGVDMGKTLWYSYVHPTGGTATDTVVLSARGSIFQRTDGSAEPLDTVMAVYNTTATPTTGNFVRCNDDTNVAAGDYASQVSFTATDGQTYKIQVGSWWGVDDGNAGTPQTPATPASGDVVLATEPAFASDARAQAVDLPLGTTVSTRDNLGAGIETNTMNQPLEATICDGSPFGSTVWYRVQTPSIGDLTVSSGPFDTVMAIYSGSSTTPITCNDDVNAGASDFTSRIVRNTLPAGTYLVQVGGWRGLQSPTLNVSAAFVDRDVDRDGHAQGADCDDSNAAIHPGATEVAGNGVDDDCAGGDASNPPPPPPPPPPPADRDGDGIPDASDACPTQNARGGDRNGNGCLDGNVVARGAPTLRAVPTGSGVRVVSLVVSGVARGSRVSAACTRRRACARQSATARRSRITLRRFRGARLRAGTTLEIRITRPDAHARVIRYRVTRGNFRRSELCITLGSRRVTRRCGS